MIGKTKFMLTAILMVISLSTPAFAQSYNSVDTDHGGVNGEENGVKWHDPPPVYSARPRGRALYDMARQNSWDRDPNSAAATGGGSVGYNQMLLID